MTLSASKVIGTPMNAISVGVSSTSWGNALNAAIGELFGELRIQVSVTFNASATGDAVIHKRHSTDDGTTNTNNGTAFRTVSVDAGNTVIIEFIAQGGDYIEIGVENKDTTYTLTATVKYEGIKITGLS